MEKQLIPLLDLIPALVAIGGGYALARFRGLNPAPLQTLLRYLLFPAILFVLLFDRMPVQTFGIVAGIGAATVVVGAGLVRLTEKLLRPKVSMRAAVPDIACFSIPFLALSWGTIGLGTACALYVGVEVAAAVLDKDPASLTRQPWVYAAAAAPLLHTTGLVGSTAPIHLVVGESVRDAGLIAGVGVPLVMAGLLGLFLLLGASLHPFRGVRDMGAWVSVLVRFVAGAVVGIAAVRFLPMSREVMEAVVIAAFAPPSMRGLQVPSAARRSEDQDHSAAHVGTLVSLAAMSALLLVNW